MGLPFTAQEIAAMQAAGVTPPVISKEMIEYTHIRYALLFASFLYAALSAWVIIESGISAKTRDAIAGAIKNRFFQIIFFYIAIVLILTITRLPISLYSGHFLEHSFNLSHQTLSAWLWDLIKAKLVDGVVAGFCFWLAFTLVDRFQKLWPWFLWLGLSVVIGFSIFLSPLLVDPLFNKFVPMPSSPLRAQIQGLAARAGIPNAPIFVVNKSKQTSKLNAYVTGLGPSARVVIWDNTLTKLPPDEVLAIVGHELGHYALHHIIIGYALTSGGLLIGLLLLHKLQAPLLKRIPRRWRIWSPTDTAMITVLVLWGTVLAFLLEPISSGISRAMEAQADAYGLKLTGNGPAMARMFVQLSEQNLSEPNPPAFIRFWFFDHPSLRERIDKALGVDPPDGPGQFTR